MEKRIMRLAWNSNWWKQPSGHNWDPANLKKKGVPFEKGTGYGHEDWLFDPRFQKSNYQYGFIQGVNSLPLSIKEVDQIHLYTIEDKTGNWYYLGYITNVLIINESAAEYNHVYSWVKNFSKDQENELKLIGTDFMNFRKFGYMPNIYFKKNQDTILSEPILIDNNNIKGRLTYYKPIKVDDEIQNFIDGINERTKFIFISSPPGKRTNSYEISRKSKNSQIADKRHNILEKELYEYLLNIKNIDKQNISCGKTEIEGKIIDIAVKISKNKFELFEIKTEVNTRLNIRAALGQLFDYGLWLESITPEKFIVVGESPMNLKDVSYFERLKEAINIKIEYWYFKKDEINEKRFKIY